MEDTIIGLDAATETDLLAMLADWRGTRLQAVEPQRRKPLASRISLYLAKTTGTITARTTTTVVRSGTTAGSSWTITALATTADLFVGMTVTGTGIPADTTIVAIDSGTQVALSNPASASGTNSMTFVLDALGSGPIEIFGLVENSAGTFALLDKQWTDTGYNIKTAAIASGTYVIIGVEPYTGRWLILDVFTSGAFSARGSSAGTAYAFPPNTILQFGSDSKTYTLVQSGTTVTIPDASGSTGGMLSNTSQTIGGQKTFSDNAYFPSSSVNFSSTHLEADSWLRGTVSENGSGNAGVAYIEISNASHSDRYGACSWADSITTGIYQLDWQVVHDSDNYLWLLLTGNQPTGICGLNLIARQGGVSITPTYQLTDSTGAVRVGATGTSGGGDTVYGGIITTLGSGSGGTVTSISGSGGTTGLTLTGGPITGSGTLTLGGALVVSNGGTGATTLAIYAVLLGNGTGAITPVSGTGTSGQVLTSTGAASPPGWATAAGGVVTSAITGNTTTTGGSEKYYICSTALGAFTVTLTTGANYRQHIRNNSGANNVTVAATSGSINGTTTLTPGQFATYVCDGTNWFEF